MPPPRRDLELTRKRLVEWFARILPDAKDIRIDDLAGPGTTGFSSDTLMFDLHWSERGQAKHAGLVARFRPGELTVFPEYDIALQYHVQKILSKTDVPVARMFWFEEDEDLLGGPFYVMERLDGRIPSDNPPYHVDGWMKDTREEERAALWWNGLEAMSRIHRLDWESLGFRFLPGYDEQGSRLAAHLAYYRGFLAWAMDGRPHPTCDPALEWLEANRPEDPPPGLVWGDARVGNIIYQGTTPAAIVDWEMARIGGAEEDLAWWIFLDRHHSEGVGAERLPGFPSRDETIGRYQGWLGRELRNLDWYEVFAAMRFSVIMARLAGQLKKYDVLPMEADFEYTNPCSMMLARLLDLPLAQNAG